MTQARCPGPKDGAKALETKCPRCGKRRPGLIGEGDCCPGDGSCQAKGAAQGEPDDGPGSIHEAVRHAIERL